MRTQHMLSRRQFLRRATTGAAALTAAPLFVPGHVLGANGATPPNSRITMALMGCGSMGSSDATQHHNTGLVQFVAFCDVDKARRDKKKQEFEKIYAAKGGKEKFPGIEVYNDFREVIARQDIDAVDIATPDHWHAIPVIAAAKAGKDIYGQKPICDVEIGCRSVTVCHLINIGHWTGKSFRWDPVKEQITGDAEAARWVDRERRAPWKI